MFPAILCQKHEVRSPWVHVLNYELKKVRVTIVIQLHITRKVIEFKINNIEVLVK